MTLTELGFQEFNGNGNHGLDNTRHYNTGTSALMKYRVAKQWRWYESTCNGNYFIGIFKSANNNYYVYLRVKGVSTTWICPFRYNHLNEHLFYFYGENYGEAEECYLDLLKTWPPVESQDIMEV